MLPQSVLQKFRQNLRGQSFCPGEEGYDAARKLPNAMMEHWHGAATRVPPTDTAFPHRQYSFNLLLWSTWENPAESELNIRWTRECWETMKPFLVESSYGNYLSEDGDAVARAAYGSNYDRLVALKNKYDPTNFFRMNHNIKPTKAAQAVS